MPETGPNEANIADIAAAIAEVLHQIPEGALDEAVHTLEQSAAAIPESDRLNKVSFALASALGRLDAAIAELVTMRHSFIGYLLDIGAAIPEAAGLCPGITRHGSELIEDMPASGCAVSRAEAGPPGFYPCLRDDCDNPNANILSSGMVCRMGNGTLVRPDIWPEYCHEDRLAALPTAPYQKLVGLHQDGFPEY
ncbi:MAG TPA: hypothetical protein VLH86_02675 [Patescibacteria group bacterium]|nr:hypothetical protein [Patescibacteria group bacterium]